MPYVNEETKEKLAKFFPNIKGQKLIGVFKNPGELNYLFTLLAKSYIKDRGENYQHWNDVLGALDACGKELYRRKVAPYEDKKIKENGDVL